MFEVELKAKCKDGIFPELEQFLTAAGYQRSGVVRQEDDYYNHPSRNFVETDEALRLRRLVAENGEETTVITYKGTNHSEIGQSREELETRIGDAVVMRSMLDRLGFIPVAPVYKTRTEYVKDDVTICLDSVETIGNYIEIEILCGDAEKNAAQQRIEALLREFDFAEPVIAPETYLELVLRKQNIFRRG